MRMKKLGSRHRERRGSKRDRQIQMSTGTNCLKRQQTTTYRLLSPASAPPEVETYYANGFGFGTIFSGAAPNSAVVAQKNDRQLEQIVLDDMLSAARQTRCSRPRITRVPSSPMMAEKATAFGPGRTTREVAPCSLARSP